MANDDIIVSRFGTELIAKIRMPFICVLERPDDYPTQYCARLWDYDHPTRWLALADTLEEVRRSIPAEMERIDRAAEDSPVIVETWV